MRINIYAEETTNRIAIIEKIVEGRVFTALRFYTELPATVNGKQYKGPFIHHPGDDDSSAVTFWGKKDMRVMLKKALKLLDKHYAARDRRVARLKADQKAANTLLGKALQKARWNKAKSLEIRWTKVNRAKRNPEGRA